MATQLTFTTFFMDSDLNEQEVKYELPKDNCDCWEALIHCWREAISLYSHPESTPVVLKRFNSKIKTVRNFHALTDMHIRFKNKDGKGKTLSCTGTNYTEIGCEISA